LEGDLMICIYVVCVTVEFSTQYFHVWILQIHEEQVVMAHSPLRMFQQYHNKRVLISGQGPIVEIAKNLGFEKIVTIEELRCTFPMLDAVDHKRRISVVSSITICVINYYASVMYNLVLNKTDDVIFHRVGN
jgi:ribonucleotide monophosphatase NagD (HAD superfamily)